MIGSITMNKLAAGLLAALALVAAPVAIAPGAQADVCGDVGGRHVDVGGCTPGLAGDAATDAAVADVAGADYAGGSVEEQAATGQPPCYTPEGVPYYTPGADPCY